MMKNLRPVIVALQLGLCGIWPGLTVCAAVPQTIQFWVKAFTLEGHSPLSLAETATYFQTLQNRQHTLKSLQDAAKGLENKIRSTGQPFYRVVLPPQTLTGGEVKMRIVEYGLGQVIVEGNQYFSKDNIVASLPDLAAKQLPNPENLANALKVANKHPAKQVQLTFKPSSEADHVDAKVLVTEQRPYQASVQLNTLGTRGTGSFRLTGALQHSNLWGLDHIVNASYTTSPNHSDEVEQYGTSYSLPLYRLKGWLSGYYAFSNVNNGTVAGSLTVTGSGEMYGMHYQQFLPKWGRYEHSLDFGLDNRFFINNIQFFNVPLGNNVRSVPASVSYRGEYPWRTWRLAYHAQWVGNTGVGDYNSDADYRLVRRGATQDWNLLRYGGNVSTSFGQWLFQANFTAQHSQDVLIAGEQLGVGGSFDVRGYQERETSADSGEIVKLEIATPKWNQFNVFAFYDYGHGHLNNATGGKFTDWSLSGTGIGAAWQWRNFVQAKVAVGNALEDGISTKAGDSRIHASIVLRY